MSFDRIAPYYRWMEYILAGDKLHRCRTAFLGQISTPTHILLIGEGHGRSLVEYRRRFPRAQIACVDASIGMLTQARLQLKRCRLKSNRVQFIHADITGWTPPPNHYDLVVINFFFDCFPPLQLEAIIFKLARASAAGAIWLIADFRIPRTGWPRLRSRLIIWLLYRFFRFTTGLPASRLPRPEPLLAKAGFTLRQQIVIEWGLLHSEWWQSMSSPDTPAHQNANCAPSAPPVSSVTISSDQG